MRCSSAKMRAHPARAPRHLELEQLLERHVQRLLVGHRRDVVVLVDDRGDLHVRELLAELLDRAVQVADVRRRLDDDLAVEEQVHPEHAVRRRVLRPEVQQHQLGFGVVADRAGGADRPAARTVLGAARLTSMGGAGRRTGSPSAAGDPPRSRASSGGADRGGPRSGRRPDRTARAPASRRRRTEASEGGDALAGAQAHAPGGDLRVLARPCAGAYATSKCSAAAALPLRRSGRPVGGDDVDELP